MYYNMAQPGEISTMDVCIGMDVTGSMGTWINASRETVIDAVNELRTNFPSCTFRLSFVGYRDFGDEEQFVVIPFTEQIETVQQQIEDIYASGGNDTPEDVAGALEKITGLEWTGQKKLIFFVSDAPPHGTEYHPITMGDRFPEGDPNGRNPMEQMNVLASMGIDFTMFRVTKHVDTMIEKFHQAYQDEKATGKFKVLDVEKQLKELSEYDLSKLAYEYDFGLDRSLRSTSSDVFRKGLVLMATDSLSQP
jgi:hypothetical protein